MGLRAKFNLLMLLPLLLGLALAAGFSWPIVYRQARSAALRNAAIMMSGATAISVYTDREIAPLLEAQLKTRFTAMRAPRRASFQPACRSSQAVTWYGLRSWAGVWPQCAQKSCRKSRYHW